MSVHNDRSRIHEMRVAGLAIALGTAFGGWRIIRTLGMRITEIHPVQGFAAQTSSASVILVSSHLGFPLSTTQVCSGAIFGAGAGRRLARVHWGVAGQMAIAWTLTLPAAAIVGAVAAHATGGPPQARPLSRCLGRCPRRGSGPRSFA